jgi:hypothetical protein
VQSEQQSMPLGFLRRAVPGGFPHPGFASMPLGFAPPGKCIFVTLVVRHPSDLKRIELFAGINNFLVIAIEPGVRIAVLSGNIRDFSRVFQVRFVRYRTSVATYRDIARTATLPTTVAQQILSVQGLKTFPPVVGQRPDRPGLPGHPGTVPDIMVDPGRPGRPGPGRPGGPDGVLGVVVPARDGMGSLGVGKSQLTGSRYFGTHRRDSDWDFFAQDSPIARSARLKRGSYSCEFRSFRSQSLATSQLCFGMKKVRARATASRSPSSSADSAAMKRGDLVHDSATKGLRLRFGAIR